MKTYQRICPSCKSTIVYSCRMALWRANKINGDCKKCSSQKLKVHLVKKGEKRTQESIRRFQETIERTGVLYTRPKHSNETKRKIRESKLKHYEKNGELYRGCVNPKACEYLDKLSVEKDGT